MELTDRKKKVLRSVVDLYIRTAEPVGSKAITELPDMKYSSATIRNEMADLTAMGYLEQPHTSAGRIPSAAGYRLYVDELMLDYRLTMDETHSINAAIEEKMERVDRMVEKVARLVSQATDLPAISMAARQGGATVKRFDLILAGEGSFILVLMLSNDEVVNKLIKLPLNVEEADLKVLGALLNATMTGTTMTYKVISGTSNLISTKIVRDRFDANLDQVLPVPYTEEELAYAKKFKDSLDVSDKKRLIACIQRAYPEKSSAEINEMYEQPMANWYCHEYGNGASTDAGDVSWVVPGCQLHVACYPAGLPFHSWQMVSMGKSAVAKRGLRTAAKVLAMTALDFMLDPEMVKQARADFEAALDGETYRCPLPKTLVPGDKSI